MKWGRGTYFNCNNANLTTLEGCPQHVKGGFYCGSNKLVSLEYAPKTVLGDVFAIGNQITSLTGIGKQYLREINGILTITDNPIESHILGVLLIKNLESFHFDYTSVQHIINNHLDHNRDILECREELIQAGFKEYAKL